MDFDVITGPSVGLLASEGVVNKDLECIALLLYFANV